MKACYTRRGVHLLCTLEEYAVIRSALVSQGILLPEYKVEPPK